MALDIRKARRTTATLNARAPTRRFVSTSTATWNVLCFATGMIKIGAKVVHHARSVVFQMAEVAVPRKVLRLILERIRRLRLPTAVSGWLWRACKTCEMAAAMAVVCSRVGGKLSERSKW
jgi:hypothetical protein